jgi:hypothetical protein
VIGGWKQLHDEELYNVFFSSYIIHKSRKVDGWACSMSGRDKKCLKNVGQETGRDEITLKTWA